MNHPRWCTCRGTGFISAPPTRYPNGEMYPNVLVRCPGLATERPAPDLKVDQKRKAAGETEEPE